MSMLFSLAGEGVGEWEINVLLNGRQINITTEDNSLMLSENAYLPTQI